MKEGDCVLQHKVNSKLFSLMIEAGLRPSKGSKFEKDIKAFGHNFISVKKSLKQIEVSSGLHGEVLGVEACLGEEPESMFTVIANSQPTILYVISRHDLIRHFRLVIPALTNHFKLQNQLRLKAVLKKLENILQLGSSI